jgi:hypothetical protein
MVEMTYEGKRSTQQMMSSTGLKWSLASSTMKYEPI